MKIQDSKCKGGFSLLEIMVVVAIMGIMASTVVIGFNSFERTVRVQETAGVITDTIKNLELEMIRRDYAKQIIHFEENYLVSEAEAENQVSAFSLKWNGEGGCASGEEELEANNATPSLVYLAQRDTYGNNLNLTPISAGKIEKICVAFMDSKEIEQQYQLFQGAEVSQTIRFIHFNIRRDDSDSNRVEIEGNNYTLQISAPYAVKEFYDGDVPKTDTVELTVKNGDDKEVITLQS